MKKGKFSKVGSVQVELADGSKRNIKDVSKQLSKQYSAYAKQLKKSKAEFYEEEYAVETKDFVVLAKANEVRVKKPKKLGKTWKVYGSFLAKQKAIDYKKLKLKKYLKKLSSKERKNFESGLKEIKKKLKTYPKDHPLVKAYSKGEDKALIAAIMEGKGDVVIEDVIVIPKKAPYPKKDRLVIPKLSSKGSFDFGKTTSTKSKIPWLNTIRKKSLDRPRWRDAFSGVRESKGLKFTARFMTGWTKEQSWEWSRVWKFPSGSFQVKAGASYVVGFRVPVEVTGEMSPQTIHSQKGPRLPKNKDKDSKYKVFLNARAFDADKRYYNQVGLSGLKSGTEIPLFFKAYANCRLRALFKVWINPKGGKGIKKCSFEKEIDLSFEMKPVFGKRDVLKLKPTDKKVTRALREVGITPNKKGWIDAALFVPPSLLGSNFNLNLGPLSGRVAAAPGVKIGGSGKVTFDYEERVWECPKKKRDCTYKKRSKEIHSRKIKKVTFKGLKKTKKFNKVKYEKEFSTKLSAMKKTGFRKFGFQLSNPAYIWKITITPGIKIMAGVKVDTFFETFKRNFPVEIWLKSLRINIGTLKLATHKGTPNTFNFEKGRKTFAEKSSSEGICVLPGTLIMMADGRQKKIENIHAGDQVLSYDLKTRQVIPNVVTETFTHTKTKDIFVIQDDSGAQLGLTDYHRVYADHIWRRADEVKVNATVLHMDEDENIKETQIKSLISKEIDEVNTYNIALKQTKNFFANGILIESE